jgi:hypothetical protein
MELLVDCPVLGISGLNANDILDWLSASSLPQYVTITTVRNQQEDNLCARPTRSKVWIIYEVWFYLSKIWNRLYLETNKNVPEG